MKTRTLSLAIAVVAVMSLSAMAFAYGPGSGRGGCGGYAAQQALTPEQQDKLDILKKEYLSKTQSVRQEVYAKHLELEALLAAKDTDKTQIDAVTKDLVDLKGRLFEARVQFREDLKELGITDFGRGRGFCGRGGATANCPGYNQGNTPCNGGDCAGAGRGTGPRDGSGPCGGSANCPGSNG